MVNFLDIISQSLMCLIQFSFYKVYYRQFRIITFIFWPWSILNPLMIRLA